MFLHYLLITDIINIYDYHIGIPLDNLKYLYLHMIVTAISMFIVLYLYINKKKEDKKKKKKKIDKYVKSIS